MENGYRTVDIGPTGRRLPCGGIDSVSLGSGSVTVSAAGETFALFAPWLRDNCPCAQCRIEQTDERRRQPWRDDPSPAVAAASVVDGALVVSWASGHESAYTPEVFAAIDRASHRGAWTARIWASGYQVERFDHDATIADPVTRREFLEAFRRDGALVVTGSPVEPGSIIEFMRATQLTLRDSSLGLIFDVMLDPAGYNIAFTAEEVPPHNDNAQYTHPPSGQVLAMLVNDATGGHSYVVDTWNVLARLAAIDPTMLDVLERVPVGHRQYSKTAEGFSRNPLLVRDRDGQPRHLRFSNQLMQPLEFDDPDLAAWYEARRTLGALIADPDNHVAFRLEAGESLFVNNHRVLHARQSFHPDGPRHLQDIYFDADDVIGQLDRLTGDATDAMVNP